MIQVADTYQQAVELFEKGNYSAAEEILKKLLSTQENDFDVMHFLGVINLNLFKYEEAISYFSNVISLCENHPYAHYNLAFCYQQLKDYETAVGHYKKVIELQPSNTDALNNAGLAYFSLEEYDKSEYYYKLALENDPANSSVNNNLGNLFLAMSKFNKSADCYEKAISADPGNSDYHYNLGTALLKQKNYEQALESFKKSIQLNPGHKEAYNNMGNIYMALRDYKSAEECFGKIISLSPDNEDAYFNLGMSLQSSKQFDSAEEAYRQVLKLNPDKKEVLVNIGDIYSNKGESEKSEEYYNQVLTDDASRESTFTNLGVAKLEQGFVNEAIDFFDRAIKTNNKLVEPHYNKAHALLLQGRLEEGWKEYQWRFGHKNFCKRKFSKPRLKNQDIKGKRILVYDEQGLGDSIHFVRYLPLLKELGCTIFFECDPRLALLYKDIDGYDQLIARKDFSEPQVEYDYQIALLNLPFFFKTNLDTIPSKVPYIKPEPALVDKYKGDFFNNDFFKVGIAWGGNPNHTGDKKRSCRLKEFESLFSVEGIKFYSLQIGQPLEQLKRSDYPVINLSEFIEDMPGTAAFIQNLNLIISVDTSLVHLTGALAKPVWMALPFLPDWRWLLNRSDSPWYPTMKIFRQSYVGNWKGVFEEIKKELEVQVQEYVRGEFEGESEVRGQRSEVRDQKSTVNQTPCIHASMQSCIPSIKNKRSNTLYLGLSSKDNFGWGIVSKYLKKELSKALKTINIDEHLELVNANKIKGKIFHLLTDVNFYSIFPVRGDINIGHTAFENEITEISKKNAKDYDLILGTSNWCKQKMLDAGIKNGDVLVQGIDPELFYPQDIHHNKNLFIIFSGGKFELRKGQDIVLKAVKILQDKYDDVILVNAWYNLWPEIMVSMNMSRFINFELKGRDWQEYMLNLYRINGLDEKRIFTLPIVPNEKLRELYHKTDIGLFPNRCEGGTNLVLMEYMACGRPVIASFNTGQRDVLTDKNSYPLLKMSDFKIHNDAKQLVSDWKEPDLDEVVAALEYAYFNREEIKRVGLRAAEDMKKFTWKNTADNLLKFLGV
jgi:tetratricopeptide (TPR) repeat protein/glycosyltransferase involved in cell wall biosynthesis